MQERTVDLTTSQGTMETFIVHPDGPGPFPVVLFYMDAPAIRDELYDMARRIAGEGYYVMLPDLFYRVGKIRFPVMTPRSRLIWRECMRHMSNADVMEDTEVMISHVDSDSPARGGKLACIGFCMSGRLVTAAAGTFPERVAVISSLYGVGIVTGQEDSSHFLVDNIEAECHFAFAETDSTVPAYVIPTLSEALTRNNVTHTIEVLPGTQHGFSFPSRDIYDEPAAEHCWKTFFDMCDRQL